MSERYLLVAVVGCSGQQLLKDSMLLDLRMIRSFEFSEHALVT